jgi:ribosomal protein S18 acetylase RimI-like enzyme
MATTRARKEGVAMPDVTIRPLAASDRAGLAAAFAHLSDDTRRRRFRSVAKRLGERELDRLTRIDHHAHEALVAVAPDTGQIVGVARFITLADDPQAAEVGIAVDDEWQHRGIGRQLMDQLVARARAERISRLVAYVNDENLPVLAWVRRAGGLAVARDGDETLYSFTIDAAEPEREAAA